MKAAVILVAVVALLAGCGASTATPTEQPGVFMTRILREEINGQWAKQWDELHPGHKKLISRAAYVSCSRGMATNFGTGKEIFQVLAVQDDPIDVEGVPQKTAKLVTISLKTAASPTALTYRLHAVAVDGHWTWILGGRFLAQVERGRCLDGSPLRR